MVIIVNHFYFDLFLKMSLLGMDIVCIVGNRQKQTYLKGLGTK